MGENKRYYYKHFHCYQHHIVDRNIQDEDGVDWIIGTANGESDAIDIVNLLNRKEEQLKRSNQEILACHDTLVTIEALCDAVLNYDFKNVEDKTDFCHMLNEMDNKDLMFFKECFEAIRNNDLKQMTSLTLECNNGDDGNEY